MIGKVVCLVAVLGIAPPAAWCQNTNADVLRENEPAIRLWSDPELSAAYRPYFDCYAQAVGNGPGSSWARDADVVEASTRAQAICADQKRSSLIAADRYLASFRPNLTERERGDLLMRYRRQMGFFALAQWCKSNGHEKRLKNYLKRTGRSAKSGRTAIMLTIQ